jgi:hypothetical protein
MPSRISCRRCGPKIEPRFHDRVFTIFETFFSRGDVESSGTRLAIVEGIGTWRPDLDLKRLAGSRFDFVFIWQEATR